MKSQLVRCDDYAINDVMITRLSSLIEAVSTFALENIVLLCFSFCIDKRDKLIRLTVFDRERTATQNIIFTVVVQLKS